MPVAGAARDEGGEERIIVRRRGGWGRRLAGELVALLLGLLVVLAAGLVALDTAPGHRFLVDRIGALETATGLKIRIGRIEGSLFGEAVLKNVRVADPEGDFLTSPEIRLDWAPLAWLYNQLYIDTLSAREVRLLRVPKLRPGRPDAPILPGFDIHIGRLTIERLMIDKAVGGTAREGRVAGRADIRAGRAMVDVSLLVKGGDRLALRLDAEPDRDRFDLDVAARSPADGLIPAWTGLKRSIDLRIAGNGTYARWRGKALMALGGAEAAALDLAVTDGRGALSGTIRPSLVTKGRLQRLTAPAMRVTGSATLDARVLDGEVTLASPALRAVARGVIDLKRNRFGDVRLGIDLLRPAAMLATMKGRNIRAVATLDGPMATPDFSYRLTSPQLAFDRIGLTGVKAEGRGRWSEWPVKVPLTLTAKAVSGAGDIAGGILANSRIRGTLLLTKTSLRGERLELVSDKLKGLASLLVDFRTGRFDLVLSGGLNRYLIPGLGLVDVRTELKVVPGPGGKGSLVTGRGEAIVRRLDNGFFASLMGGLPRLTSDLSRGPDGVLRLTNLQLYSPKLRLSGQGRRDRDGSFHVTASGRHSTYGPLTLQLDGRIERPQVLLTLAAPNAAMGIRDMGLRLVPNAAGYDFTASGQSRLGPFDGAGQILLPRGGAAVIDIARLTVAGTRAAGRLRAVPGGLDGALAVAGGGVDGTIGLNVVGRRAQDIELHLALAGADFPGPPALRVTAGRIDGHVLLDEGRTTLDGVVNARGLSLGGWQVARLTANGKLVDGAGTVRAVATGRRGAPFDLNLDADIAPERIVVRGQGTVARRPLRLEAPAVLRREDGSWVLDSARLAFAGGRASLSGRMGSQPEVHARLSSMPLDVIDLVAPDFGLSGVASGTIDYAWKGRRSGEMRLVVKSLSRAGLVLASKPIDLGLNAKIDGGRAGFRAVAQSDGKVIGRAQGRFAPVAGGGGLFDALRAAPAQVQLRYAGPADTLWRLGGVEVFDLSGPLSVGLDLDGAIDAPRIRGALRTEGARIESAVTGTVVEQLRASGRFAGSMLTLTSIEGKTPGGGALAGSGTVNFAGGTPDLDLNFTARSARLLDRDDIGATLTGPFAIRSEGRGGVIRGQFKLDEGRFTLGRASAASKVPTLAVRQTGGTAGEVIAVEQLAPWRLDVSVAGGPLVVRGLGIDSRWTTKLDIGGAADAPRMTGTATLDRGDYEFAGRNFRLEEGTIRFRGQSPPNPLIDIRAAAEVQGLDASVMVTGTGLKPEIRFSSVPALPEDELLSRILFGTSITNLSAPEALQLGAAVASLRSGGGGLDPINAVRRAVGLDRLRIVPADIATGQKTAISAGKYIGKKLFVEVVSDGQGYSATQVEYRITRWLSLLSSISTIGRTSANVRVEKDY